MRGIQVQGTRFRQVRRVRGLTQQDLARLAGVAERTVRNAEAGKSVRLDFLRYLAVALGVDVLHLVHDRDELRVALSEQRRVDRLLAVIEAHAKEGDHSELYQLVSRDIVLNCPAPAEIPFAGEYRSADGLKTFFDRSVPAVVYEQLPEATNIRTSGNLVVISGIDRARAAATGKSISGKWLHVYEFEYGHIRRLDIWSDMAGMAEAFQPG